MFSVIGVLLGLSIFNMQISIIMTGIGIVALAGIVVRNGILLVEFTDLLIEQGYELYPAIIEAGRTRMTPVILTASATILGLIPLAVGLNIDFVTLFSEFNPHIFFGGEIRLENFLCLLRGHAGPVVIEADLDSAVARLPAAKR